MDIEYSIVGVILPSSSCCILCFFTKRFQKVSVSFISFLFIFVLLFNAISEDSSTSNDWLLMRNRGLLLAL